MAYSIVFKLNFLVVTVDVLPNGPGLMGVINNQQSLLSILINHMHGSSKSDLIRDLQTFTQETTQSRIQTGSQLTLETPSFFLTFRLTQ